MKPHVYLARWDEAGVIQHAVRTDEKAYDAFKDTPVLAGLTKIEHDPTGKVGWHYSPETGEFTPVPAPPDPTLPQA